jgi:hypothetical protein
MSHASDLPSTWSKVWQDLHVNSLWILPLVALERVFEGHPYQAAITTGLWIASAYTAVKFHALTGLFSNRGRQRQLLTWALILGGGASLAYGIARLATDEATPPPVIVNEPPMAKDNTPVIAPYFAQIYPALSTKLGPIQSEGTIAAINGPEARRSSFIAFFEHGSVIWVRQKLTFYRLRKSGRWDAWRHSLEVTDTKWWNPNYIRGLLNLSEDKTPPDGGVAYEWSLNIQEWEWLGSQQWECVIDGRKVIYQKFEKGMLIGNFPVRYGENEGQVFILYDDGSWDAVRTNEDVGPCL